MEKHSPHTCVCDYGEICQAHGEVEVTTKIWGAVSPLDRSKMSPEVLAIIDRMHESVAEFKRNLKKS